jgi:preprotein translocase subunit SecG
MLLALWYHSILATLFALVAVLLMGVILLQRGKGVGLSGAFGGAGGHTAFGAKTGDVLTWATIVVAAGMLVFAVILNYVFVPVAAPAPAPTLAPPTFPAPGPVATPEEATDDATLPPAGATTPAPTGAVPSPTTTPPATETPPAAETEKPNETTPGGGGDVPGWPGVFGADPG